MKSKRFLSLFFVFFVFVYVAGVLDYVSTRLCLSVGLVELNPISLWVFPTLFTYVAILIGYGFLLLADLKFFDKVPVVVTYIVVSCMICFSFLPCVHNFWLFLR